MDPCHAVSELVFERKSQEQDRRLSIEAQAARAWRRLIHAKVVGAVLNSFQWSTRSMCVGSEWVFLFHEYFCQKIYKADPWPHSTQ